MKKKTEDKPKIKSLEDADAALSELAVINAELDAIKGRQSKEEIARTKNMEKHAVEAAPLLKQKEQILGALETFAEKNRENIFGCDQSIKLMNGKIGFQKSKRALARKEENKMTEAEIAHKIWHEIDKNCAEQTFRMNKEEIKKRFTPEQLAECGLYILQVETFFAEDKFGVRF